MNILKALLLIALLIVPPQAQSNDIVAFLWGDSQGTKKDKQIRQHIRTMIHGIHKSHLDDKAIGDMVKFYEEHDFKPYWIVKGRWSVRAQNALDMLGHAEAEGLFADNYAPAKELVVLKSNDAQTLARQDILMTHIVFRYLLDLLGNRFTTKELRMHTAMAPQYESPSDLINQHHNVDDSGSWMKDFSIEIEEYQQLKELLALYRQQQAEGQQWSALDNGSKLTFGSRGVRVKQLRRILAAQGDYDGNLDSQEFDMSVEAAVKGFQKRHGLLETGVVDNHTRIFLNIPLDEKIRRIVVTMERWRWLPSSLPKRYVWVNIPSFHLQGINNRQTVMNTPVIIGKFYDKTPVFSSSINQIRFNPHWTAPHRIAVKHILPKIQEDPTYFNQKGFVLLSKDRATEINPDEVNWQDLSEQNFPYVLRQKSGKENALGRIRFSIQNPWHIYIHSTPETKLFQKHKRMFSSGCIRVKSPEKLAAFVLNDSSRWPETVILKVMNQEQRKFVELTTKVPVYMVYFTVWVQNKKAYFVEDIYKKDESLDFLIHSLESRRVDLDFDSLMKPKTTPRQGSEISEELAKEIFTPTSALDNVHNSTSIMPPD